MDRPSRLILDTNLRISYLISSRLLAIDRLLEEKKIVLLFSPESLQEFIEVVRRPKFEKFFSEEDVKELLILFDHFATSIATRSIRRGRHVHPDVPGKPINTYDS